MHFQLIPTSISTFSQPGAWGKGRQEGAGGGSGETVGFGHCVGCEQQARNMCNGRMGVLRQAGGVQRQHLAVQCDTIIQPLPDHYQPIARRFWLLVSLSRESRPSLLFSNSALHTTMNQCDDVNDDTTNHDRYAEGLSVLYLSHNRASYTVKLQYQSYTSGCDRSAPAVAER